MDHLSNDVQFFAIRFNTRRKNSENSIGFLKKKVHTFLLENSFCMKKYEFSVFFHNSYVACLLQSQHLLL